jgi:hypothetical protein
VIYDESGLRAQAVRPQPGAVAVSSQDEQLRVLRCLHHLMLDAAAPFETRHRTPEPGCGGTQEAGGGLCGQLLEPCAGITLGMPPA